MGTPLLSRPQKGGHADWEAAKEDGT